MTKSNIDFRQLFNPTKLFCDYLKGGLKEFYRHNYLDNESLSEIARDLELRNYDRDAIYSIVKKANTEMGASGETLANIELLKKPETVCVFAGQQTAFCASPMYVVYKALAAVKLAERFGRYLDRPVVPCFWMATDDHDFEEVRNANFLKRSGEIVTIAYNPANEPANLPITSILLDQGVEDFCDQVGRALIDTEFKRPLLDEFGELYKPGIKLSRAFAGLFNRFLGEWGIILIDPNFPGIKELFRPIFAREISEYENSFKLYEDRSKRLLDAGYHIQVHKTGENLNLFYHAPGRSNLVIENGSFKVIGDDIMFTREQLLDEVEKSPAKFSSNVLLRPIAQCHVFPTLAHIVGPSELAYFAQIEPLFEFFDVPFPSVYPRSGMTIIEPQIKKILDKYDLEPVQLKNNLEGVIGDVIERLFPSRAANDLQAISDRLNRELEELAGNLEKADPEGYRHISNFNKHMDYEIKQLNKKLKAVNKKRHEELIGQLRRAHAFLFPNGGLQERLIAPLYYANKFGPGIFRKIYEYLDVEKPVHSILEL